MARKARILCATFTIAMLASFAVLAHSDSVVRISVVALKNFGDAKAKDDARLRFIAARIAEQAVHGVTVVDELQDKDGSAFELLHEAVIAAAGTSIEMALSESVGGGKKEQYGYFWNPAVVRLEGEVETLHSDDIERDPACASFKAKDGFDFTLLAFHTRPSGQPLRDELASLADILDTAQSEDETEQDIILAGDFNAPPDDLAGQKDSIRDGMSSIAPSLRFAIRDARTNVLQTKTYDNLIFVRQYTDEYIDDGQHVVRIDEMLDEYEESIPGSSLKKKISWFGRNVMDHCPVYANFRADEDSD